MLFWMMSIALDFLKSKDVSSKYKILELFGYKFNDIQPILVFKVNQNFHLYVGYDIFLKLTLTRTETLES